MPSIIITNRNRPAPLTRPPPCSTSSVMPKPMTPDEFRAIRMRLGLTQAALASHLGFALAQHVSKLERGELAITDHLGMLMRAYAEGYRPDDAPWPPIQRQP